MRDPRAGQPAQLDDLVDVAHLVTAYLHGPPRSGRARPAGRLRHVGAPRFEPDVVVQRGPHRRHDAGDLRVPLGARRRRPAVPRARHPRPVRAGVGERAGGARRQRRHRARRRRRPLHADAGRLPRHPPGQSAAASTGSGLADGIVVTPSHNPPSDGGFKYNPPHGGPADTDATGWIARRANELLAAGLAGVRRTPLATARQAADAVRLRRHVRRRPARRRRRRRHPRRRRARRRRSARRGERRLLGGDRRAPPPRPHRRQPGRRPDVALHDARLGRPDPHGLLVTRRHGVAHRATRASSRSPPATTPTPTATASSPRTAG